MKDGIAQSATTTDAQTHKKLVAAQQILMELGSTLAAQSGDVSTLYHGYKEFMMVSTGPLVPRCSAVRGAPT